MNRAAEVRLSGKTVGVLTEGNGRTSFSYLPEWLAQPNAQPVSLTMPLRAEPYTSEGLHPFFDNLLPEGWFLDIVSRKCKVSKGDAFGIMLATCAECVGAVEIVPIASTISSEDANR